MTKEYGSAEEAKKDLNYPWKLVCSYVSSLSGEYTYRMKVKSGWLYRYVSWCSDSELHEMMCFVPTKIRTKRKRK